MAWGKSNVKLHVAEGILSNIVALVHLMSRSLCCKHVRSNIDDLCWRKPNVPRRKFETVIGLASGFLTFLKN